MKRLLLAIRYYPIGSFFVIVSLVVLVVPLSCLTAPDAFLFRWIIVGVTVGTLCWNHISCHKAFFKIGELNTNVTLELLGTLKELESKLPIAHVYANRPKRPWLFWVLWSRGIVQKRLMRWMGVDPRGISIADKNPIYGGIAGKVDTRAGIISISSKIKENHPEAYLTTLTHEIAHVLESRIGLHSYVSEFEEEFTDVLCVFMGLGDVMLNGCVSSAHESKWYGTYTEERYERQQVGYLMPMQLALAEVFVIEMVKQFGKVRKHYNSFSYSLLMDARFWLVDHGIDFCNTTRLPASEYIERMRQAIESIR